MASPLASTSRLRLGSSLPAAAGRVRQRLVTSSATSLPAGVGEEEPSLASPQQQQQQQHELADDIVSAGAVATSQPSTPQYEDPRKIALDAAREKLRLRSVTLRNLESTGSGSTQTRASSFRPHRARLDPVGAHELTVSHLLAATAHVGHRLSSLNRAASAFVYGKRHDVAIIDVERHTLPALKRAAAVVRDVASRDGVVLFLGTAPGTQRAVLDAAKRLGQNGYHVTKERWMPGVISNAPKLLGRAILGDMAAYTEGMQQQQQQQQRNGSSDGPGRRRAEEPDAATLASQVLVPDLVVVLNPKANLHAIREATERGIPTVGIVDTDVDPRIVTYAIPANDESVRTAELVLGVLSRAGHEGLQRRAWIADQHDKGKRAARRLGTNQQQQQQQHQHQQRYNQRQASQE